MEEDGGFVVLYAEYRGDKVKAVLDDVMLSSRGRNIL